MPRAPRNTSFELRQLIIWHHTKGKSGYAISKLLQVPMSTVYDIIARFEHEERIEFIRPPGRPEKLSIQDKRLVLRMVRENPKVSAPKLATEINARNQTPISAQSIRQLIKKDGYHSRTARCKPLISKTNQEKRLEFAEKYISVDLTFWANVIFSDESKFNVFGSDGKQKVWRRPNTELSRKNLNVTVKHGGGKVMVWGCFAASGVGSLVFIEGNMNAKMYIDILRKNLRPSAEKLGISESFLYYQDNDPKHKAHETRMWLLFNCPKVLETPPQSPDCNPIENLWEYLDRRVRETPISSVPQLKKRLLEEWNKIPTDYLQRLVQSMPRRLEAVLRAKGMHTKY